MPQMSPFNWTSLMIMYISFFILMMCKVSFVKSSKSPQNFNHLSYNKMFFWMW